MRARKIIAAASSLAVAATLTTTLTASAAPEGPSAPQKPAATNGDGANTALGNLLGSLSYRGAEHPYLVGNLADAVKRFGATSAQANAARAGLLTNIGALADLLGADKAQKATFRKALTARADAELAYAAAVAAKSTSGQSAAKATLDALAGSTAASVHDAIPAIAAADFKNVMKKLNAGDEATLKALALNLPSQFAGAEKSSIALATAMRAVGLEIAAQHRYAGVKTANGSIDPANGAAYRALLEQAFVEHVYQTGLFGMAILRNGPTSAAAKAARVAENANTALDASLLGDLGASRTHTAAVWNQHITGYGDYLTGLATGSTADIKASTPLLTGYEAGITAIVKKQVPAFNNDALRASYTEHVNMTLTVFKLEKANSAAVYPMALMGARHFSDLAISTADKQTRIKG